jgi:hypothetical protein
MKIFNLNADEWDRTEEREGWRGVPIATAGNPAADESLSR